MFVPWWALESTRGRNGVGGTPVTLALGLLLGDLYCAHVPVPVLISVLWLRKTWALGSHREGQMGTPCHLLALFCKATITPKKANAPSVIP